MENLKWEHIFGQAVPAIECLSSILYCSFVCFLQGWADGGYLCFLSLLLIWDVFISCSKMLSVCNAGGTLF